MPDPHIKRTVLDLNGRITPLVARVNRRAKRLILKVDPAAGEIHVTAPSIRAIDEAIAFATERKQWIASQLNDALLARPFEAGGLLPLRGENRLICHDSLARRPVALVEAPSPGVLVGGEEDHLNRRLCDWMKREARKDITAAVDRYCEAVGKKRRALRIRDTRTRWGSCSSEGDMSFSWRLIMAPPEILDYVAAHECVHLIHMDHSRRFWRDLTALGVDARAAERWFDQNGATLFSYGVKIRRAA